MIDYCHIARWSLDHFLAHGRGFSPSDRAGFRAGCFVTLHEKTGQLRGCIGTIEPVKADLALEVAENAVAAGIRDPRFPAVAREEMADLQFEVSVLGIPREVAGISDLDPKRFGVVVRNGMRRGVLLPEIPGIETAVQQVEIAKRKASIGLEEPVDLWRFEVEKYRE